jgi:hypothetical protein
MSRPPKPDMSDEEYEVARQIRAGQGRGTGHRAIAAAISVRRGATTLNPALNRRRGVSEHWVRRQLAARERDKTPSATKPDTASNTAPARQNSFDVEQRETEPQTDASESLSDRKPSRVARFAVPGGEAAGTLTAPDVGSEVRLA